MINWKKVAANATKSRSRNRPLLGGFVLVGRTWDARIEVCLYDEQQYLVELVTFKHCTKKSCGFVTINSVIGKSKLDAMEELLKQAFDADNGVPSFCGMRGLIHAYVSRSTKMYSFGNSVWRFVYGD